MNKFIFNSVEYYKDIVTKAFYSVYLKCKDVELEIDTIIYHIYDGYVDIEGGFINKKISDKWNKFSVTAYVEQNDEFNIGRIVSYFENLD